MFAPSAGPSKVRYTVQKNIVYTPPDWQSSLKADVYVPASTSPVPAVLLIHGGGWKGGDGRWQMRWIARRLAARGYVVMNATYRTTPQFRYPTPLEDMRQAIVWMRTNSSTYHIDPQRIATFGYSAGGHLASLVALKDENHTARVKAIVAGGAPFDLKLYPGGDLVPAFLGGTQSQVPEKFRDASPLYHVGKNSPPIFIYHAAEDKLVQPDHALRMQAAYARIGKPTGIYWIPKRGHIDGFFFSGHAVDAAIDFLDRTMK